MAQLHRHNQFAHRIIRHAHTGIKVCRSKSSLQVCRSKSTDISTAAYGAGEALDFLSKKVKARNEVLKISAEKDGWVHRSIPTPPGFTLMLLQIRLPE